MTEIIIHSSLKANNINSIDIPKGQFFYGSVNGYVRGLCLKIHNAVVLIMDDTQTFSDPHPIVDYTPVSKVTIKTELG